MTYGPIEFVVLKFPGNQFSGEIAPALQELVDTGIVRIIDLLFVIKDGDGNVGVVEVDGLGDAVAAVFKPLAQPEDELLSQSDGEHFGELLEPNSSAALLLFENTWAARFVQSVQDANGEVLMNERIPRDVIDAVLAEASAW
ncbi:MAG TPA: DUF6325 family protein [Thermomicrobiales bacterium]|nr:DUF6325 family protein [Thermomicrobiales bacterium]